MASELKAESTWHDYQEWTALIRERCGLDFSLARRPFVEEAFGRRVSKVGSPSREDYCLRLWFAAPDDPEWAALVDELVIPETAFYRDPVAFETLRLELLPWLWERRRREGYRGLSLYSAGCSIGPEAYSLALCLEEATPAGQSEPGLPGWVVAADISRQAINATLEGSYRPAQIANLPAPVRDRYLKQDVERGKWTVGGRLRRRIFVALHNLAQLSALCLARHDVIFCQNVLIYFAPADRRRVVEQLLDRLRPGGLLFLGAAEAIDLHGLETGPGRDAKRPFRLKRRGDSVVFQV